MPDSTPGLTVMQDLRFQEREWRAERVGWVLMALVVVAAVLGLFGHGLLGYRTVTDASGELTVELERVARKGGTTGIEARVSAAAVEGGSVSLWLSNDYRRHVLVEGISPQPSASLPDGEGVRYDFEVSDASGGVTVRFQLRPDAIGPIEGALAIDGRPPVRFRQYLLP